MVAAKREQLNISISHHMKKELDSVVAKGNFTSVSDLCRYAIQEFLIRYEGEHQREPVPVIEHLKKQAKQEEKYR